jgi:hypothetical protein
MNIKDLTNVKWSETPSDWKRWFPPIEDKIRIIDCGCGITIPESVPDICDKKEIDPRPKANYDIMAEDDFTLPFFEEDFNVIEEKSDPGFIVIHQNVGSLPPYAAEAYCLRVKEQFTKGQEWLDFKKKYPNWSFLLLPTNENDSWVEVFHKDDKHREEVGNLIVQKLNNEPPQLLQDSSSLYEKARNYVYTMLGAPVVKVELTLDQLTFCYKHSLNTMADAYNKKKEHTYLDHAHSTNEDFFFSGVLAHAKIILGRIRMSQDVPADGRTHLTGEQLYQEGKADLNKWKEELGPDAGFDDSVIE